MIEAHLKKVFKEMDYMSQQMHTSGLLTITFFQIN